MASSELPHVSDQQSDEWGNVASSTTPIGVDVGVRCLVAAAPAHEGVEEAFTIEGDHVRESFRLLRSLMDALRGFGGDTTSVETALVAAFWKVRLKSQLHGAAARTVRYAREYPGAVLVLEDLPYDPRPLYAHRHDAGEIGAWLLPALQDALVEKATAAGIPVAWIDPAGTSIECHRCGERGEQGDRTERLRRQFRCLNDACPVDVVDADVSAAVSIAKRV